MIQDLIDEATENKTILYLDGRYSVDKTLNTTCPIIMKPDSWVESLITDGSPVFDLNFSQWLKNKRPEFHVNIAPKGFEVNSKINESNPQPCIGVLAGNPDFHTGTDFKLRIQGLELGASIYGHQNDIKLKGYRNKQHIHLEKAHGCDLWLDAMWHIKPYHFKDCENLSIHRLQQQSNHDWGINPGEIESCQSINIHGWRYEHGGGTYRQPYMLIHGGNQIIAIHDSFTPDGFKNTTPHVLVERALEFYWEKGLIRSNDMFNPVKLKDIRKSNIDVKVGWK